jgi:cytochrome c oxidase accessory protein FixG
MKDEAIAGEVAKNENGSFRDTIATINSSGKRNFIFPKKPNGKYYKARTIVSLIYLVIFFSVPFIHINGEPLFLLDFLQRRFILFGVIFWPQDFVIFGIGMLTFMVFIVLFTIAYGRVFCGWVCPQTVFMEMVFRKIEYWVDGNADKQRKLAQQEWNSQKIIKRTVKWSLFYLVSVLIANTFLSYIIGEREVLKIASEPISQHMGGFAGMLGFSFIFFGVYAWFREQVCIIACPYGRLQGVLLDPNSILVAYDYQRGEPKGKLRKALPEKLQADCVDCSLCVQVCPTGIDIRNGTQLECVNCTACMDACDAVMHKINKPAGLIRYASENGIKNKTQLKFTARLKAYSVVLTLLVGLLVYLLASRSAMDVTVLRAAGQLFDEMDNGKIANLYNVRVINKSRNDLPVQFKIESGDGNIQMIGKPMIAKSESKGETTFFIIRDKNNIHERKTKIKISVWSADKKLQTVSTTFLGPVYDPEHHEEEKQENENHP